jgi:hypothetical protein
MAEAVEEILDSRGVAVMPLKIKVHAGTKTFAPQHGLQHPADFRALFVHGRRVEIVDLAVGARPDRVRQRPGIFGN